MDPVMCYAGFCVPIFGLKTLECVAAGYTGDDPICFAAEPPKDAYVAGYTLWGLERMMDVRQLVQLLGFPGRNGERRIFADSVAESPDWCSQHLNLYHPGGAAVAHLLRGLPAQPYVVPPAAGAAAPPLIPAPFGEPLVAPHVYPLPPPPLAGVAPVPVAPYVPPLGAGGAFAPAASPNARLPHVLGAGAAAPPASPLMPPQVEQQQHPPADATGAGGYASALSRDAQAPVFNAATTTQMLHGASLPAAAATHPPPFAPSALPFPAPMCTTRPIIPPALLAVPLASTSAVTLKQAPIGAPRIDENAAVEHLERAPFWTAPLGAQSQASWPTSPLPASAPGYGVSAGWRPEDTRQWGRERDGEATVRGKGRAALSRKCGRGGDAGVRVAG
ncbi:hypothetical protein JCM10450v2_006637 [Rhodotorula kratochvilovae]